jgi:hypothetical protein
MGLWTKASTNLDASASLEAWATQEAIAIQFALPTFEVAMLEEDYGVGLAKQL